MFEDADTDAMARFFNDNLRAPLAGPGIVTQFSISCLCVGLTAVGYAARHRPLFISYGIVLGFISLLLLQAITRKNLRAQRFFLLCYMFLLFMLTRALTFAFGWYMFSGIMCTVYDVACVSCAVLASMRARPATPAVVLFYVLFLIPHDGASPFTEPALVSLLRTGLTFALFFVLQYANTDASLVFPDSPQIDDILFIPRCGFVLLTHPIFWPAIPAVASIGFMRTQKLRAVEDIESRVPTPPAASPAALAPPVLPAAPAAPVLPAAPAPAPPPPKRFTATAVRLDIGPGGRPHMPAPQSAAPASARGPLVFGDVPPKPAGRYIGTDELDFMRRNGIR
jgi:hypothetical protein